MEEYRKWLEARINEVNDMLMRMSELQVEPTQHANARGYRQALVDCRNRLDFSAATDTKGE